MLLTASTVKDTLPNLERFVARNLAGGVDHMIVFLDAGDPEVRAWLDQHPHVTCVRTDQAWWRGQRPAALNVRQRINANAAKAVLSRLPWAGWVFHVDADEVVQVDRDRLEALPQEVRAVRLTSMEAVSRRHWEGEVTHFKRQLSAEDLTLLHVLGVIDRPKQGGYFHGHVDGKVGMRPAVEPWLALHHVIDTAGERQEAREADWLRLLHYESVDGEEFVRKWTSILQAGPTVRLRPGREPTAVALRALIAKDLTPDQARPHLMRIFERTTEDDFETLRDLALLEEHDPLSWGLVPREVPGDGLERLHAGLAAIAEAPKSVFEPGGGADPAAVRAALDAAVPGGGRSRLPWRR
jgi:hypothetical protein